MFGRFKGKPASQSPLRRPRPDADGVTRLIPKAIFDGRRGAVLRALGFGPDDPSNLVLTQDLVNARMDRRRERQAEFVRRLNDALPSGVGVLPWAMIPWSIWKTPIGDYLFRQDMYPVDFWNTMLLAADEESALALRLPRHPRAVPAVLLEEAERYLGEIALDVMVRHRDVLASLQKTGDADLTSFFDASAKARRAVRRYALQLAAEWFGEDACDRHRRLFGEAFGDPNVEPAQKMFA